MAAIGIKPSQRFVSWLERQHQVWQIHHVLYILNIVHVRRNEAMKGSALAEVEFCHPSHTHGRCWYFPVVSERSLSGSKHAALAPAAPGVRLAIAGNASEYTVQGMA